MISRPDLVEKAFIEFTKLFREQYGDRYGFVQGHAVGMDVTKKVIMVKMATEENSITEFSYDSLIIATGSSTTSPLWTLHGSHNITMSTILSLHNTIASPQAKTILIVGGGATGVETAGEIAYQWPNKDVSLVSGGSRCLANLDMESVGKSAELHLKKLGVKVIHQKKVLSAILLSSGATSVDFTDGSSMTVDVYIDATGGKPNTGFLPQLWLDSRDKTVLTDVKTLRVTNAVDGGVYCIGDAASYSNRNILDVHRAVAPLGYSLWADLTKRREQVGPYTLKERLHKQDPVQLQLVPIGPNGGVGTMMGCSIPSFLVWLVKSRTFLFGKIPSNVNGDLYKNVDVSYTPV